MSKYNYNHNAVEKKWQKKWEVKGIYNTNIKAYAKQPFYNLFMFPYPSAEGLHAGHAFSSTGSDIFGRFMRMNEKEVFQPIGYDSFGIHSENYAIKVSETPQKMLSRTIKTYTNQLKSMGHGYDWTRSLATSDPDYYKWTQWLFVKLFKAGLAYRKEAEVNWCPSCKTVLADEQVMTPAQAGKDPIRADGKPVGSDEEVMVCERCGTVVERKILNQWFLRITHYAERLLKNLDSIDWSERVVKTQKEWIGKKEGITITYPIDGKNASIDCFTTRPDTNFGATFIVVSPEYARENLADLLSSKYIQKVTKYINTALNKTEQQRKKEGRVKTGVFTGLYALNRLNNYKMPVWVSDFVLAGFGTGAVVGVPGHDKRDFEFAKEFNIPVKRVVVGSNGDTSEITTSDKVEEGEGIAVNSEFLNGMNTHKATEKILDYLEKQGWGKRKTTYHLRDWLISRQRYWGPPIPMIYCKKCAKDGKSWFTENSLPEKVRNSDDWSPMGWYPEENLPVLLPELKHYLPQGTGKGPLADHPEFYETKCPVCGSIAKRETDVSDTFLDSSWYFLAYPNIGTKEYGQALRAQIKQTNKESAKPFNDEILSNWLPVDLYFGGAEHAVLHLMYARFISMALSDLGIINFEEPFTRFFAHGLLIKDGAKMSKSRGNVVNPDEYIKKYGADTLRLYTMFLGPMDGYPDFRDTGIEAMRKFLERLWQLFNTKHSLKISKKESIKVNQTIKKVTKDIKKFRYNTAIASIMELVNFLKEQKSISKDSLIVLCKLIAPFTPHLAEEVWVEVLGKDFTIHKSTWPKIDTKLIKNQPVNIAIQVNGKVRAVLRVAHGVASNKNAVAEKAIADPKVSSWLKGKKIVKTIFVPQKIINFVLK